MTISDKSVAGDDKARLNWRKFEAAKTGGHEKFETNAKRNNDFYAGEQWDPADKQRLDHEGRPALTLNMILSTVNGIIGEQLDRKVDPIFSPDLGGMPSTALALNRITRCILNRNDFDEIEEDVFADGIITGRGYYDVRMAFENNIQGEVTITSEDPVDVILPPGAKEYDPRTWPEVYVRKWKTIDDIELEWGQEKAEKIRRLVDTSHHGSDDNFQYEERTYGGVKTEVADEEDTKKVEYVRVIERQYYKNEKMPFYLDPTTGDIRPVALGVSIEDAKKFAEENELHVIERIGRRVWICTSVDDVLLADEASIYRSFTIVPFFAYFRRGRPFSPVDNLIDPQNLLNKTSSQELHIVNTTANSGWVMEENSLVDMDADELAERGSETGLVLQYKRGYQAPEKIQPNQIPTGIDRISQKAATTIREVSGINASMLGSARADMSGVAQDRATQRGQVQVSVLVGNLRRARKLVLQKILELVQDFYTETRYYSVASLNVGTVGQTETVGINEIDDDGSILNDVTVGTYGVEVGFRASGPTAREVEFETARMLRELGVAVPDHYMVKYSNLTESAELAEFLKNSQGYGEPTEEQQQLEDLQMQHQIGMLKRELEKLDADIEVAMATAAEKMSKVRTLEGFNEIQLEMAKLQQEKELKERELSLRVALAARGHQNQLALTDKRNSAQLASKVIDVEVASKREAAKPENPPKKSKESK